MNTMKLIAEYQKHSKDKPKGDKVKVDLTNDSLYSDLGIITCISICDLATPVKDTYLGLYDFKNTPVLILHTKEDKNTAVIGAVPIFDILSALIGHYTAIGVNVSTFMLIMHYLYQQYYKELKNIEEYIYSDELDSRLDYYSEQLGVELASEEYRITDDKVIDTDSGREEYIQ